MQPLEGTSNMRLQERARLMRKLQGSIDYLLKILSQLQYELWQSYVYDYVAELNQEGLEYFGGLFEKDQVPIKYPIAHRASFTDIGDTRVYMVDLETLQEQDPEAYAELFLRLSRIHSDTLTEIMEEADRVGLPLRAQLVAETISKYERARREAPELSEVVDWWDQFYG